MKLTSKYLPYFFWLAPTLIMAGLTASVISQTWSPTAIGLLIVGVVILGFWLLSQGTMTRKFWGRRSTEASTNALISTLAVLLLLGLINFLGVRYLQPLDLTETQLFTLAPQTKELLQNLRQPLKVWVFTPQPNPQTQELLMSYQRWGQAQFSFEFVDPQAEPSLANNFGVKDFGDVYLEVVPTLEDRQSSGTTRREFVGSIKMEPLQESRLTNAIARVQSGRKFTVYFLQGHGERPLDGVRGGLSQAIRTLQDRNYTSQPLNLADRSDGVPADADVVVVAGPKQALFPAEVTALQQYLQRGGSVLLLLDPNTEAGLDSLLREWGVRLDSRFAVDATGTGRLVGLGPAEPLVTKYGEHPITQDFRGGYSFYPLARPLEVTPVPGVEDTPLLITADQSWAESDPKNQKLEFNAESDRKGPLILGVALTRTIQNPGEQENSSPDSRLVVIGNSEFATDGRFGEQLNGDVFLNAVSWLADTDQQTLSIRPKEVTRRRLNITPQQNRILGWSAIAVLPLLGLVIAVILWFLRR